MGGSEGCLPKLAAAKGCRGAATGWPFSPISFSWLANIDAMFWICGSDGRSKQMRWQGQTNAMAVAHNEQDSSGGTERRPAARHSTPTRMPHTARGQSHLVGGRCAVLLVAGRGSRQQQQGVKMDVRVENCSFIRCSLPQRQHAPAAAPPPPHSRHASPAAALPS